MQDDGGNKMQSDHKYLSFYEKCAVFQQLLK